MTHLTVSTLRRKTSSLLFRCANTKTNSQYIEIPGEEKKNDKVELKKP